MNAENIHTPQPGGGLLALINESVLLEQKILTTAEENGGEIDPWLDKFLTEINTQIEKKSDNYKFIMDRLEMSSSDLEAKADQFYKAAQALDDIKEAMKDRIKVAMNTLGKDEIKGKDWRFKLSKTKGRLLVTEKFKEELPQEYLIIKTVYEPDKDRIRAALESGKEVRGATIEPGFSLRSYVNRGDK